VFETLLSAGSSTIFSSWSRSGGRVPGADRCNDDAGNKNLSANQPYGNGLCRAAGSSLSKELFMTQESLEAFAGKKIAAGVCGILLGALGIHKFILGLTTPGLIMLLVSVLTCGFGAIPMGIIGLVEGIIYLTKSDQEFYQLYAVEKKQWF
jgi:TM2 domain-containing membrane protein YozV